jgi:hypothetical protein
MIRTLTGLSIGLSACGVALAESAAFGSCLALVAIVTLSKRPAWSPRGVPRARQASDPRPQIAGARCGSCERRIASEIDGSWCASCSAPLHRVCRKEHRVDAHRAPTRHAYR